MCKRRGYCDATGRRATSNSSYRDAWEAGRHIPRYTRIKIKSNGQTHARAYIRFYFITIIMIFVSLLSHYVPVEKEVRDEVNRSAIYYRTRTARIYIFLIIGVGPRAPGTARDPRVRVSTLPAQSVWRFLPIFSTRRAILCLFIFHLFFFNF